MARWRWLAHSWRVEIDPHLVRCDRRRRRRRGRPQHSLRREQSRKEEEPEVSDNRTKQARPRRASAYARPRLRRGRRPTPAFSPPGRQHGSTSLRRPTHPPGRQEVMVSTWPPGATPWPGRAHGADDAYTPPQRRRPRRPAPVFAPPGRRPAAVTLSRRARQGSRKTTRRHSVAQATFRGHWAAETTSRHREDVPSQGRHHAAVAPQGQHLEPKEAANAK